MAYIPESYDKVEYNVSWVARIVRMGFKPPSESGIRRLPGSEIRAPLPGYIRYLLMSALLFGHDFTTRSTRGAKNAERFYFLKCIRKSVSSAG